MEKSRPANPTDVNKEFNKLYDPPNRNPMTKAPSNREKFERNYTKIFGLIDKKRDSIIRIHQGQVGSIK